MANLCNNKITVTGSPEAVKYIKSLMIRNASRKTAGDSCIVDYQIVKPVPEAVKGIAVNSLATKHPYARKYSVEKTYSKRIGLVKPKDFPAEALKRRLIGSKSKQQELEQLLTNSRHFTQNKAIEECLQDSIRDGRPPVITPDADRVLELLARDTAKYAVKTYGYNNQIEWGLHHWSNRWDIGANAVIEVDKPETFVVTFSSAVTAPENWFDEVLKDAGKLGFSAKATLLSKNEYGDEDERQIQAEINNKILSKCFI